MSASHVVAAIWSGYLAVTLPVLTIWLWTLPVYLSLATTWMYFFELRKGERGVRSAFIRAFPLADYKVVTFRTDLFCAVAVNLFTRPALKWIQRTLLTVAAGQTGFTVIVALAGKPTFRIQSESGIIAIQATMIVLAFDFHQWFQHYLLHKVPILWATHKVHHSAEALNLFVDWRDTVLPLPTDVILLLPLEFLVNAMIVGTTLYLTAPSILPAALSIFGWYIVYVILMSYFAHGRCWISFGKLNYLFAAPILHQLHHSAELIHRDKNLAITGGVFSSIFDWMFGTLYVPKKGETWRLGLGANELGQNNPHASIRELLFEPYRFWWNAVKSLFRKHKRPEIGTVTP
jgi:sterol desaturase/sphingolipid hydroxylase (fatty acid hydroxylase superfamily)